MTALPQVALAFARECLGWEDVSHDIMFFYVCSRSASTRMLSFTDLDAVIAAVKGWCDRHESAVEIGYYGYLPGEWEVTVATPVSSETINSDDLCHALMAACVAAAVELRGGT